ncbi:MAG: DUF4296 domain-containing protein [Bacteroidetes bacterium]|nr:DUF4296 domain-containing protein [Bacteroidota bacterium]
MLQRKIKFLLLLAFLIPACSQKPPISQKEFVEFYVQLHLIDAQYSKEPMLEKAKVDSLMRAFNIDDSLVNSALSWYGKEPERWKIFFADVQKRLEQIRKEYLKPKR